MLCYVLYYLLLLPNLVHFPFFQSDLDHHTRENHRLDSDGAPIVDSIGVDPLEDPLGGVDPLLDQPKTNVEEALLA